MEKEAALLESGKENEDLCSFYEDELTELYSSCGSDTCGNRLLAIKETLILCGLAGFFEEYVPVFLAGKNVYRTLIL